MHQVSTNCKSKLIDHEESVLILYRSGANRIWKARYYGQLIYLGSKFPINENSVSSGSCSMSEDWDLVLLEMNADELFRLDTNLLSLVLCVWEGTEVK